MAACRDWAYAVASPATVLATAYVHAARQLKYPDVSDDVALAVAESAAKALVQLRGTSGFVGLPASAP